MDRAPAEASAVAQPQTLPLTCAEDRRGFLVEVQAWPTRIAIVGIRPGVVKAWYRHKLRAVEFYCIVGEVHAVWWHEQQSEGQEEMLSPRSPLKVQIPPGWWYGWKNVGQETAYMLATMTNPEAILDAAADFESHPPHDPQFNGEIWRHADG